MEEGGAHGKHAAEIYQGQKDVLTPNPQKEMAECDDSGVKSKEEMGMLIPLNYFSLYCYLFFISTCAFKERTRQSTLTWLFLQNTMINLL